MENIIKNTRAKRITRIYSIIGNQVTTATTPDKNLGKRLRASARGKLNRLRNKARKAGFSLSRETYNLALERIAEMETMSQYEDFCNDTKDVASSLCLAIKTNRDSGYFFKIK